MNNTIGLIIDIDGVLIRDGQPIPKAEKGIELLEQHNIPYCLLSNGNGNKEWKAKKVNSSLGTSISSDKIVLAITPLEDYVDKYANEPVLIIGKHLEIETAKLMGYKKIVYYEEYFMQNPSTFPDINNEMIKPIPNHTSILTDELEIKAIFIMHTPVYWGEAVQVICDVLRARNGSRKAMNEMDIQYHQQIPIFMCNPDFEYCGKHPMPRLTVGAFGLTLNAIWKHISGEDIQFERMGKPFQSSYQKAEKIILNQNQQVTHFYGIGDNPLSDIRGANDMKKVSDYQYSSVLVKSGCSDPEMLKIDTPDIITDDFFEAIQIILKENSIL